MDDKYLPTPIAEPAYKFAQVFYRSVHILYRSVHIFYHSVHIFYHSLHILTVLRAIFSTLSLNLNFGCWYTAGSRYRYLWSIQPITDWTQDWQQQQVHRDFADNGARHTRPCRQFMDVSLRHVPHTRILLHPPPLTPHTSLELTNMYKWQQCLCESGQAPIKFPSKSWSFHACVKHQDSSLVLLKLQWFRGCMDHPYMCSMLEFACRLVWMFLLLNTTHRLRCC